MLYRIIDRPVSVSMLLISLLVLGLVSLRFMPVSIIPEIDVPEINIQIDNATLSSSEMDALVLKPLRARLQQIDGLEDLRTEARDGSGRILLYFSPGANTDYLSIEVNEKIDRTLPDLPSGLMRPKVLRCGFSDIPAFYLNLTLKGGGVYDDNRFAELSDYASSVIAKRIEQLEEVAMVDLSGMLNQEILIKPDLDALSRLGLSLNRFEELVKSANIRLGTLYIHDGEYRYNVRFVSYPRSADDLADIHFTVDGKILKLCDIASVSIHPCKPLGLVRSGSDRAITMAVIKHNSARMAELRKQIENLLSDFSEDYPEISFSLIRDQTALLDYSINSLLHNILFGVILALIIIFLFMRDFKSPLLVALTIPTALIISMLILKTIGIGINILSLSGLIIGVGMMVDNSIILVDNITARWQRGEDIREAVLSGTSEVRGAMLSSVLTTCAVFVPLLFVSGMAGALFHDQAISIAVVLLIAWLVTVTIIPVYYYQWYKRSGSFISNRFLQHFNIDKASERSDQFLMRFFIKHNWVCWFLLAISFVGALLLFIIIDKQKLPPITYTETILHINWNEPVSLDENDSRILKVETVVADALQLTSYVGSQGFVHGSSNQQGICESSVFLSFKSEESMEAAKAKISSFLLHTYPLASFSWELSGNIFESVFADKEAPIVAHLRPTAPSLLNPKDIRDILSELSISLPDVNIPAVPVKTDVVYVANNELMMLYGVSFSSLLDALKTALGQNILFEMAQGGRSTPVVLDSGKSDLKAIFENTAVHSDAGIDIPVALLMRQTTREDLKVLTAGIEGNYYPVPINVKSSAAHPVMSKIEQVISDADGFDLSFSGSWFSTMRMTKEMTIVIIIAVILLYLILAAQFESLLQPVIILSEIIIDIFFCLFFLYIAGIGINIMSLIGLVVVCGIVINDSILKIDTINQLRKNGLSLEQSVMVASHRRVKAIIMTSLTTILSIVPTLSRGNMGADLQFPMSVVIIVGMMVGTFISLFVVPALYYAIYNGKG